MTDQGTAPTSAAALAHGRLPCAHCDSKGTCKVDRDERSCRVCWNHARSWRDRLRGQWEENAAGAVVPCSVCRGKGYPVKRLTKGVFAMLSGLALMLFIFGTRYDTGLDKIYASLITLLGTMVGYYFGGTRISSSGHAPDE
jgi:hypothetical protein